MSSNSENPRGGDIRESIILWLVLPETTEWGAPNSPRNSWRFDEANFGLKEFYCYVVHPCSDKSPISGKPGDGDA